MVQKKRFSDWPETLHPESNQEVIFFYIWGFLWKLSYGFKNTLLFRNLGNFDSKKVLWLTWNCTPWKYSESYVFYSWSFLWKLCYGFKNPLLFRNFDSIKVLCMTWNFAQWTYCESFFFFNIFGVLCENFLMGLKIHFCSEISEILIQIPYRVVEGTYRVVEGTVWAS